MIKFSISIPIFKFLIIIEMAIITMTKWTYELVVALMVEVSHGECWQDSGSKVGIFGGGDNNRGGACGG